MMEIKVDNWHEAMVVLRRIVHYLEIGKIDTAPLLIINPLTIHPKKSHLK